jgi:hypothetical protein
MPFFDSQRPKNSGMVDVQRGDIAPGTATEVLVLDMHGIAWPTGLRDVLAAAGLDAGLLVGGDDEFIVLERAALPLPGIQIQQTAGFGGEVRIAWKDPTAVIPRSNSVFIKPAPQCTAADGGHQTIVPGIVSIDAADARFCILQSTFDLFIASRFAISERPAPWGMCRSVRKCAAGPSSLLPGSLAPARSCRTEWIPLP